MRRLSRPFFRAISLKKSFSLFLLGFAALCATGLPSTARAEMRVLTWEDCVREARLHNPDLAAADEVVIQNKYGVKASVGDYFPSLSFDSGFNTGNRSSSLSTVGGSDAAREFEIGGGVRQNVFNGLKTRANYKRSQALLSDAEAARRATVAQVSFDLRSSFARLLFAQERLALARRILERRRGNTRLINLRYEGGSENKGSLLRSRALEQQANFQVFEAERTRRTAQTDLARFMGWGWQGIGGDVPNLRVTGSFQTTAPVKKPPLEALVPQTPVYTRAWAQWRASQAGVGLARGDLFPSIDASATVSRVRDLNDDTSSDRWTGGVSFSYPFLIGGRDVFEAKAAKAEARRAEANVKSVDLRTRSELQQTHAAFENAVGRVAVQESFLAAARSRAEISRSQYSNGLVAFFDWDSIENDLILNEQSMLETRRDALIAEADWRRAQGKGAW